MNEEESQHVVVTDIRMPFLSMVVFMIKWAVASIPAFIILSIIGFILMMLVGGMLGGMSRF
jgi:YesN/AraC family two-component response regulator